jgi:type IV fimbrial biogenesis protein FimT
MELKEFNLQRKAGFTLVELMVTIAMIAILLMVAAPNFAEFIRNNRLVTQTNAFTTALGVARSEAINRAAQVSICKSANGTACTTANNWEQGWIIFQDTDADGTVDVGEDLIRVQNALPAGYTLRQAGSFSNWIAYTATGASAGNGGNNGFFRVCTPAADTAKSRAIQISTTGRARISIGNTVGGFTCP